MIVIHSGTDFSCTNFFQFDYDLRPVDGAIKKIEVIRNIKKLFNFDSNNYVTLKKGDKVTVVMPDKAFECEAFSESKSQTVKAKVNYFEWLARINVNIYSINDAGNFAPINTDDIEQIVLNVVLGGVQISGFNNKNTDLISTQDLSLNFASKAVDRKLLIFEHWLSEKS